MGRCECLYELSGVEMVVLLTGYGSGKRPRQILGSDLWCLSVRSRMWGKGRFEREDRLNLGCSG